MGRGRWYHKQAMISFKKKKQAGHDRDALLLFVLFLVRWLQIGWEKDERPWRLVGFGLVRWCAAGACGHVLGVVVCVWSALRTNQLPRSSGNATEASWPGRLGSGPEPTLTSYHTCMHVPGDGRRSRGSP